MHPNAPECTRQPTTECTRMHPNAPECTRHPTPDTQMQAPFAPQDRDAVISKLHTQNF